MYLECNAKRIFAIAFLGKKLDFHTEIFVYFKLKILKIGLFRMVKNFLKLNQTRNRVFHLYLDYKTKSIFAIACLGKKLAFHTEIYDYFE